MLPRLDVYRDTHTVCNKIKKIHGGDSREAGVVSISRTGVAMALVSVMPGAVIICHSLSNMPFYASKCHVLPFVTGCNVSVQSMAANVDRS